MTRRLTPAQVAKYRSQLLDLRARLRHDVEALQTAAIDGQGSGHPRMSIHMADVAGDQFESERSFRLCEGEQELIDMVEAALARIAQGTFGICEATGEPISKARLNAIPYTPYCMAYARQLEQSYPGSR